MPTCLNCEASEAARMPGDRDLPAWCSACGYDFDREVFPSPPHRDIRIARRARRRALLRRIREDRRPTGGRWYGRRFEPRP